MEQRDRLWWVKKERKKEEEQDEGTKFTRQLDVEKKKPYGNR